MTSPLVSRLLANVNGRSDPETDAINSAELACYWARVGEFDEAERRRLELRREFGDGRSARVSILIMTLEALLLYFRELSPNARDRLVRANLLSVACREMRLVALTSAWLAHIDFNLNRFETMHNAITSCFKAIDADDGTAECRVSLVLGDAFLYCGQNEPSRRWYERGRVTANRLGDQAAVGAITYNRAALRVAAARLGNLTAPVETTEVASVRAEVKSATNYQAIARLLSLDHLLQSANIGVLMLEKRYEQAASASLAVLDSSVVPADSGEYALLEADRAWCLAKIGNVEAAVRQISQVAAMPIGRLSADDQALIYWSLSEASREIGDEPGSTRFRSAAGESLADHAATIATLSALLSEFRDDAERPLSTSRRKEGV